MPFDYDVFISYAHIDNATLQKGQEGWIDMLHKALELRLGRVVAMICPRRATLMLAVVLLALSNVSVANAQFPVQPLGRLTCVTTFVPNLLRAENLAARTADSRLDCTNDGVFNPFTPNNITQYVLMNVNLTLNTAVTNMLAGGGGDALVVVNENNAWNPQVGSLWVCDKFVRLRPRERDSPSSRRSGC